MLWFSKKPEITEIQKLEWEYHNKHHEYLRWEKHTMEHQYSQLLVYLNSGVFVASSVIATMYDKVDYKWIIMASWWCAAISFIFVLLSFIFSIKSFAETIDLWKERKENLNSWYMRFMKISTNFSTFFLLIALVLTLIFFSLNFLRMTDKNTQTFVECTPIGVQKNSEPVSAGISPTEFFAVTQTWETQKNK